MLYDEADVAAALPKAIAAADQLRRINSRIAIEPVVADVTAANVLELCSGVDLVLDGTDNFETRFLLNEAALKLELPWIHGGAIGASGQTMTILPGETPCLRCFIPEPPPPGAMPTCDTAGVLGPIIGVIASIQACEAIKILSGNRAAASRSLTVIDLWDNRLRQVGLDACTNKAARPAAMPIIPGFRAKAAAKRPCSAAAMPCRFAPPPAAASRSKRLPKSFPASAK